MTDAAARGIGLRWNVASILLKLALSLWLVALFNEQSPAIPFHFHNDSGDLADYVRPVENLLRFGRYTTDVTAPLGSVHRMPGYAFTLLPLWVAFDERTAKGLLVALQLLVECAGLLLVGDLAFRLTGSRLSGIAAQLLYAASTFVTVFSFTIVPDALAAHITLALAWMFVRIRGGMGRGTLLAAGGLSVYSVFLRPFLAPLSLLFSSALLWMPNTPGVPLRARWARVAIFLSLPVVAEGAWLIRNYLLVGEVIPFHTAGVRLPPTEASLRAWMISFGGDQIWWRPGSTMAWFEPRSPFFEVAPSLPAAVFTESCSTDRILMARARYLAYRQETGTGRDAHGMEAERIFDACRTAYEIERPFDHHVLARIRLLARFVVHAGPPLPVPRFTDLRASDPRFWLKLATIGTYAVTVLLGVVGLGVLVASRKADALLVATTACYLLFVFPLALRIIENRYLVAAYPLLAVASGVAIHRMRPRERLGRLIARFG